MSTFTQLSKARQFAGAHALRERAVAHVTRPGMAEPELLVFDHVPDGGAGVQIPAGGLEAGETPAQAARRECEEETGRRGFGPPIYLGSAAWVDEGHGKRELRHFFHLTAPAGLPDTWDHAADGHLFRFRWEALSTARLDWDMDAFLPAPTPEETPA